MGCQVFEFKKIEGLFFKKLVEFGDAP